MHFSCGDLVALFAYATDLLGRRTFGSNSALCALLMRPGLDQLHKDWIPSLKLTAFYYFRARMNEAQTRPLVRPMC